WESANEIARASLKDRDVIVINISHPNLFPVEKHPKGNTACAPSAKCRPVTRSNLNEGVGDGRCDPNVSTVERKSSWIGVKGVSAEQFSVAGPHLGKGIAAGIGDRNIGTVE